METNLMKEVYYERACSGFAGNFGIGEEEVAG